jgi:hypothetical protein
MSLKLNQEIWIYVERLYVHCYSSDEFVVFLKQHGVEYNNPIYPDFLISGPTGEKPLYKFMSEPNYDFANFMQTIPTYKYLPIIRRVVFDEKILATRKDGWNYYGESVRSWHPKIIEILRAAGVNVDLTEKAVSLPSDEEDFESPDFLPYSFNDLFLDYIRKEINESYNNGQLLAVIILSRKLLEALVIRIFEVVFPKMVNSAYTETNHTLWYDRTKNRYQFFEKLLENLKLKSSDFHEDKDLVEEACDNIEKIRVEANKCVHRDYKIPDDNYLKGLKIEMAIVSIRKVYNKYCNP